MSNSTTSWQEAVRLRCYQQTMAKSPESFNTPTQEQIIDRSVISVSFKDHDDRSSDQAVQEVKTIDSSFKNFMKEAEKQGYKRVKRIDQELTGSLKEANSKAFNETTAIRNSRACHTPKVVNITRFKGSDPDGLNDKIRGKYAEVLKQDDAMLLARSWGVHPADLTKAFNRMGVDWVRKEIGFVAENNKVGKKGAYLAKLLAKNQF